MSLPPGSVEANSMLALLLNTEGRRWEASDYLAKLLQVGRFSIQDLILLGQTHR